MRLRFCLIALLFGLNPQHACNAGIKKSPYYGACGFRVETFQSTLPLRGATCEISTWLLPWQNFNPRSPYGERLDLRRQCPDWSGFQSTLPLRGATRGRCRRPGGRRFQSTLPLRGATRASKEIRCGRSDFNPRSPYGERLERAILRRMAYEISIHAPLTGSDQNIGFIAHRQNISIHAPLTGSDGEGLRSQVASTYFNPRSPYGERRYFPLHLGKNAQFQSTLPLRGATIWF